MKKIAKILLEINAVSLNSDHMYTWSSGIKSPIYTDIRILNWYVKQRNIIEKELAEMISKKYHDVDMIFGTATAGISHAAYVSNILNMPMGYVRSLNKKHGKQNQIEGLVKKGTRVVIIEDLLSTGTSAINAAKALHEAGCNVVGIAAIFSYNLTTLSRKMQEVKNIVSSYYSLTNLDELLEVAHEKNLIKSQDIDIIKNFKKKLGGA